MPRQTYLYKILQEKQQITQSLTMLSQKFLFFIFTLFLFLACRYLVVFFFIILNSLGVLLIISRLFVVSLSNKKDVTSILAVIVLGICVQYCKFQCSLTNYYDSHHCVFHILLCNQYLLYILQLAFSRIFFVIIILQEYLNTSQVVCLVVGYS